MKLILSLVVLTFMSTLASAQQPTTYSFSNLTPEDAAIIIAQLDQANRHREIDLGERSAKIDAVISKLQAMAQQQVAAAAKAAEDAKKVAEAPKPETKPEESAKP